MYIKRSVILILLVGLLAISSFAASAYADQPASQQASAAPVQIEQASCPVIGAASLSTQQLRAMLDARYLYRVGQPR